MNTTSILEVEQATISPVKGRGKEDASEGLETTTEAAGARRWSQGIYDDNGGFGGGR